MYEIFNAIKAILSGVTICKGLCAIKGGALSLITTVQTLSSAINSLLTIARQPMCAPKEIHHFTPALPADAYLRMLISFLIQPSSIRKNRPVQFISFFCHEKTNLASCWIRQF